MDDATRLRNFVVFLARRSTKKEDKEVHDRYVADDPDRTDALSYIDDLNIRLELATDIQNKAVELRISSQYFTTPLWSALMVIPLENVRWLRDEISKGRKGEFQRISDELPGLLKYCKSDLSSSPDGSSLMLSSSCKTIQQ